MAIRPTRIEKQLKAPPVKSIQQQKVCDELYFTAARLQVIFHLPQLFPLAEIQLSMFLITGYLLYSSPCTVMCYAVSLSGTT